jgi:uncharacterized protein YbjT (DUF2867 family)
VWLVTGSASGLGRNIAEAVLESGDRLVATARDPKRLDDLVKKYGDRVRAVPLDVTDESAGQAAVQMAVATFGRLDVVVNNAGYGDIAPFEQLSAERFKAVMDRRRSLRRRLTSVRIVGLSGQSLPDFMVWLVSAPRRGFLSGDWIGGRDVCERRRPVRCGERSRAHAALQ